MLLVVGPSGSGKSTLARALAGLVPRDIPGTWSGSLRIGELEAASAERTEIAAQVGLLFQDPRSQLVMDRAADDVAFGLENRAWALESMREAVPRALRDAGLAGFERRRGGRLSGGEQQRLALAGVMAASPGLIVLDEPTASLDLDGAAALFERLATIKATGDTTLVLVEHRADLAWPLADLVLALDGHGTPIDIGAPDVVLARSRARFVREGIWLPGDATSIGRRDRQGARARGDTGPPLVDVADLRFAYESGRPVVRDVHMVVTVGERIALVGSNGSGKSTLLRLIAGLLRPSAGAVRIDGRDPARLKPGALAGLVGYVFQDPELGFLEDSVAAEVGLESGGEVTAAELMDRLGLPLQTFGGRNPYRLSGGEQRRLSLATALVRRPRLLILDEPTFGQDRRGWEAIATIVDELVDAGTTLLVATHDEAFGSRISDRRIEMADGWIVADDDLAHSDPPTLARA